MRDQLNVFKFNKSSSKSKLISLINELHNAHLTKNLNFKILTKYKEEIVRAGISFDRLTELHKLETTKTIIIPRKAILVEGKDLNFRLIDLIKYFSHICTTQIPELLYLIELYDLAYEIAYHEYVKINRMYNSYIAETLLKGGVVTLPHYIGQFSVQLVRRHPLRKAINWKESNIYKRFLLDNGKIIRSRDNPDGEGWLIFFTDTHYIRWRWNRRFCKIANFNYYFFKVNSYFTYNILVDEIEEQLVTKEDVINTKLMGNLQKSLMLSRKFKDIKELYLYGV